jgi:RHS repeat-associated protein
VYDLRYIDAVMVRNGYFCCHNDLFSVQALVTGGGTVVERYEYDPYGNVTVLDAGGTPKANPDFSEFGSPWTFTGRRLDPETGLLYFRNRYYHAGLGRFVARDPLAYTIGADLYEYVAGQPFVRLDPYGLKDVRISVQLLVDAWGWRELGWNVLLDECKDKQVTARVEGESQVAKVSIDWVYQQDDPKPRRAGTKETKQYSYKAQVRVEFCGDACTRATGTFEIANVTVDWKEYRVKRQGGEWTQTMTEHSAGTSPNPWQFPFTVGDRRADRLTHGPENLVGRFNAPVVTRDEASGQATREVMFSGDWTVSDLRGFGRP